MGNASISDLDSFDCDRRRVCVVLARGGGERPGGDRTTYLYNGINYSSSGRLLPPAPPKLYSNINFDEEKPFWEHLIKIRQNHNWKFSSRREEAAEGAPYIIYLAVELIPAGLRSPALNWNKLNILSSASVVASSVFFLLTCRVYYFYFVSVVWIEIEKLFQCL